MKLGIVLIAIGIVDLVISFALGAYNLIRFAIDGMLIFWGITRIRKYCKKKKDHPSGDKE